MLEFKSVAFLYWRRAVCHQHRRHFSESQKPHLVLMESSYAAVGEYQLHRVLALHMTMCRHLRVSF